jgi:hypothetical protein
MGHHDVIISLLAGQENYDTTTRTFRATKGLFFPRKSRNVLVRLVEISFGAIEKADKYRPRQPLR